MNTTADNDSKTVVERYVAAVQAGDEPAIRDLFAPDATWTLHASDLPISGVWRGRDTIIGDFLGTTMGTTSPARSTSRSPTPSGRATGWSCSGRPAPTPATAGTTRTVAWACSPSATARSRPCASTWARSTPGTPAFGAATRA